MNDSTVDIGRFGVWTGALAVPMRGHRYERPLSTLKAYGAAMDNVDYSPPIPNPPVPRFIGAIGPKALAFVAEIGWGAHTYFVSPDHTQFARSILRDDSLLAVEQAVLIEGDAAKAREIARGHMGFYLARSAYRSMLLRLGWSEDDLANGGSDALVDAIVAWGDVDAVAERVDAHFAAGADHVCLQPLGSAPDALGLDQLAPLAAALL